MSAFFFFLTFEQLLTTISKDILKRSSEKARRKKGVLGPLVSCFLSHPLPPIEKARGVWFGWPRRLFYGGRVRVAFFLNLDSWGVGGACTPCFYTCTLKKYIKPVVWIFYTGNPLYVAFCVRGSNAKRV